MSRRVFISYKFNDREIAHNVRSLFQPDGGMSQGKAVFVENDVSAEGDHAIDREIRRVMAGCECALFVVGADSHNSPWINREAQLATSLGLGLVAVRLNGLPGGLPNQLRGRDIPFVDWDQSCLSQALNNARESGS